MKAEYKMGFFFNMVCSWSSHVTTCFLTFFLSDLWWKTAQWSHSSTLSVWFFLFRLCGQQGNIPDRFNKNTQSLSNRVHASLLEFWVNVFKMWKETRSTDRDPHKNGQTEGTKKQTGLWLQIFQFPYLSYHTGGMISPELPPMPLVPASIHARYVYTFSLKSFRTKGSLNIKTVFFWHAPLQKFMPHTLHILISHKKWQRKQTKITVIHFVSFLMFQQCHPWLCDIWSGIYVE